MDYVIFTFIGQSFGLAMISYALSIWGIRHPNDPRPLHGVRKRLFFLIWAVAAVVVICEKLLARPWRMKATSRPPLHYCSAFLSAAP